MRIVSNYSPLPVIAAFIVGCSGSPDPDAARVEGEATFALDSADAASLDPDAAPASADSGADVEKGRERGHEALQRRDAHRHHHHGDGGGYPPSPPEPPQGCIAIALAPDGVCSETPEGPCQLQDPDCFAGQSCEAAGQTFADGTGVPSGDSCNSCGCNDGSVLCTEVFCEPVFCALFVEQPDGVCSRFPLDPCISQDPDCLTNVGSCEAAGQTFPDGSGVPSGDSCNSCSCSDGSVVCTLALCEPVFCALFIEQPDGVCSRFPLDPCASQDPDCSSSTDAADPAQPVGPAQPVAPAEPAAP